MLTVCDKIYILYIGAYLKIKYKKIKIEINKEKSF